MRNKIKGNVSVYSDKGQQKGQQEPGKYEFGF